jgi:hypothetical protein
MVPATHPLESSLSAMSMTLQSGRMPMSDHHRIQQRRR